MSFFIREGIVDLAEIEEALTMIKMRKEKGFKSSLDFLASVDDLDIVRSSIH
jgi:hypothetical protein